MFKFDICIPLSTIPKYEPYNINEIINFFYLNHIKKIRESSSININNDYLIHEDIPQCILARNPSMLSNTKSHLFSFGSNFLNISESIYIGIGHIKILEMIETGNNECTKSWYAPNSKPLIIQKLLFEFLNNKFPGKFKQNLSGFCSSNYENCVYGGYSYLSYFIKFDTSNNTFFISDFFFTIDIKDNYHFDLIFSMSMFEIDNHIYVTSGEGDYYSSILKFNKEDIPSYCKYNALDENFNIANCNYCIIIKDYDGKIHNLKIDDKMNETAQNMRIKFGEDNIMQKMDTTEYNTMQKMDTAKNKYLKYKNKYLKLKNILK